MARTLIGQLKALWRYPVKSMQGESLQTSEIIEKGLLGDRTYALWDIATQRVASAKNPKKWAALLDCHATLAATPKIGEPIPAVRVTLPNGTTLTNTQPDIDPLLSNWIEREVQFLSAAPENPSLDQYWPDVDGREFRDTTLELLMPEGTFFDSCPIHAITVATLDRLKALYPAGEFEPCRFRPNLLIDTHSKQADFIENDWIGKTLSIGQTVKLKVDTHCPRCVVTTLAQNNLPQDLNILRTTATHNNVIAGIRLSVIKSGTIGEGDNIWLETTAT